MSPRLRRIGIAVVALAVLAGTAPWAGRRLLWRWELNPVLRGRLVAEEAGCFLCHRPFAGDEIPNPGSRWQSVPAFQAGNPMMYGSTKRQGIEEYVRFGAPRAWLDDPKVAERLASQRIRMPAYDDNLSEAEIRDVVAFAAALEGVEPWGGEAAEPGRQLAREHGCLSCHGVEGSGGRPNPGSIAGFVPGFLGRNFNDLVRDRDEFAEWIHDGTSRRLQKNPLVRFIWRHQKLSMPAYGDSLGDDEIDALWTWILAVREAAGQGGAGT